jgi:hypothetical protein
VEQPLARQNQADPAVTRLANAATLHRSDNSILILSVVVVIITDLMTKVRAEGQASTALLRSCRRLASASLAQAR